MRRPFLGVPLVYLHRDPVDFRKSINGLALIVEQAMARSPYEEAVFVFCNRHADKLKVLYWDDTGFCLWQKRLEAARFAWPKKGETVLTWREEQLHWLMQGYDVSKMTPHRRLSYG